MYNFYKEFCKKLWKDNNTWNIRPLVDKSFVPASQQTSILYCRFSDFIYGRKFFCHVALWSATCALTCFFWLLSHVIYLKLTKVLTECFLSQTEWWEVKVLFLSLRPEVWTFWKLNFVNPLRFTSHQKKLRKLFTFQAWKLLSDKLTKKAFLVITVIYHSKIEAWERRHSCNSLVSLR